MDAYCVEIYEPGSARDPLVVLDAGRPFMAIAKGDIINTRALNIADRTKAP